MMPSGLTLSSGTCLSVVSRIKGDICLTGIK